MSADFFLFIWQLSQVSVLHIIETLTFDVITCNSSICSVLRERAFKLIIHGRSHRRLSFTAVGT